MKPTVQLQALDGLRSLIDLPAELETLYTRRDANLDVQPVPAAVASVAARITAGTGPEVAAREHEKEQADATRVAELARATFEARLAIEASIERWVDGHRDELIADVLGPAVTARLDVVEPSAALLTGFCPTLDETRILRDGTVDEVAAWRDTRDTNTEVRRLLAAFHSLWNRATTVGVVPGYTPPKYLRIDAPGGIHTWADPRALDHVPDVRDGRQLDVLALAHYADLGRFRLATTRQLIDLEAVTRLVLARAPGEYRSRRIHLPGSEEA